MREKFWEWFCLNANEYNLYFICCDLWRFNIPDDIKHRVIDLITAEDLVWPVAAGIARNKAKVFIYGVSFFNIGRLESLRSEIVHSGLSCYILNAGKYGYDKYGPSHAFYEDDDIKIMKSLHKNIEILDEPSDEVLYESLNNFKGLELCCNITLCDQKIIYLRLGKD